MTSTEVSGHDGPGSPYSNDQRLPSESVALFLERLRARPASSWRQEGRLAAARTALGRLAALNWTAERLPQPVPDVPDLGPHAIADQLCVLIADAERVADPQQLGEIVGALADAVGIRLN